MGAMSDEKCADRQPSLNLTHDRVISYREILEQLATDELRAGRLTRRGYKQFVQMAKEYRFSAAEARDMIESSRERLVREGLELPDFDNLDGNSSDGRSRLVTVAIVLLLVQGLWWLLF